MREWLIRWVVGVAFAHAVAYGLLVGGSAVPAVQAAGPTPTTVSQTNGNDPGGSAGGNGGG